MISHILQLPEIEKKKVAVLLGSLHISAFRAAWNKKEKLEI